MFLCMYIHVQKITKIEKKKQYRMQKLFLPRGNLNLDCRSKRAHKLIVINI